MTRGFYTVLGWATWKGVRWYLAKRLGIAGGGGRVRRVLLLAGGAAALGGGAYAVRSRAARPTPPVGQTRS